MVPKRGGWTSSKDRRVRYQALFRASIVPYFFAEPFPEAGLGRVAVAELDRREVADVIDLGPVDDVGLAPEVPAVEGGLAFERPRGGLEEAEDLLLDAVVVEAEAGRGLRLDGDAVRGHELGVGVTDADPVGRRVDVNLDDDPQARLPGQVGEELEAREIVLPFALFAGRPLDPRPDGVEAEPLDLVDVLLPGLPRLRRHRLEHGRPGLAARVPDRHGEKALGLVRSGGGGRQGAQEKGHGRQGQDARVRGRAGSFSS